MEKHILNKKKIKDITIICIILLLIGILMFFLIKNIYWIKITKENESIQEKLLSYIDETTNENSTNQEYMVDFKELKKINSDTVAYLEVNNTDIKYFVVQGSDNSYYINHNFEKNDNNAGWIFADYQNKFNFTDYNIVIYGCNTKRNSMFGKLQKALKEDNNYITLVTEETEKKYEIFSIYEENDDTPIQVDFNRDDEYLEFLNTIKSKSTKEFSKELNEKNGIITLVAYNINNSKRIVVHAISVL